MTDEPVVAEGAMEQIHDRVHVIPDRRVEFVPNIGIIEGDHAVLVIDTAMGAENGARVTWAAAFCTGGAYRVDGGLLSPLFNG